MDISDIAKLAGVSPSTVSKVINHKDESISNQTRERIRRIDREYHYVPNARSHASKSWLLGVLFRSRVSIDSTLDGILATAQEHGYATFVFNSDDDIEQERKKAMNELKGEIADLSVRIASKVVEREVKEDDHKRMIEDFISKVG